MGQRQNKADAPSPQVISPLPWEKRRALTYVLSGGVKAFCCVRRLSVARERSVRVLLVNPGVETQSPHLVDGVDSIG